MEKPIFRFGYDEDKKRSVTEKINSPEWRYFFRLSECELALMHDDKKKFLDAISRGRFELRDINAGIFGDDAAKCAKAVLEGEAKTVTCNQAFCFDGCYELHNAARFASLKVMRLFLKHDKDGSKVNARCLARLGLREGMVLPLDLALARVANVYAFADWDDQNRGSDSFKLISRLCAPNLRHRLEIVRLLALKTRGIEREAYNYAKGGKVVEFAVLLMATSGKVLRTPLSLENKNDLGRTLSDMCVDEIALLAQHHQRVRCNTDEAQRCTAKMAKRNQILLLLQIFERIGDKVAEYLQLEQPKPSFAEVATQVGRIFEEGGICSQRDVDEEDPLNRTYYLQSITLPHGYTEGGDIYAPNVVTHLPTLKPLYVNGTRFHAYHVRRFATAAGDGCAMKPMRYARKCVPQVCDHKFANLFWATLSKAFKRA